MTNKEKSDAEIIKELDSIIENGISIDYDTKPKYTVKELSKKLGLSSHTIRFYDKEHLFPFVKRDVSNDERLFSDADWAFGKLIKCLRQIGLSIHDCRLFILDTLIGDDTVKERLLILVNLQASLRKQIHELQEAERDLQYKIRFFSYLDEGIEIEKEKGIFTDKKRGLLSKLKRFVSKQKSLGC